MLNYYWSNKSPTDASIWDVTEYLLIVLTLSGDGSESSTCLYYVIYIIPKQDTFSLNWF
jgi:hypothetical protein